MKRVLLLSLVLTLALTGFAACGKAEEEPGPTEGGPSVIAPFNVPQWLETEANFMAFEYIDVPVYQDIWDRDAQPIGSVEATETDKGEILAFLSAVFFTPLQSPADFTVDFAFAMNEPFVFFGFDEQGLFVKEPGDTGCFYYKALFADYGELYDLREYIGEMRLGYFLEAPEPAQ